MFWYGCSVLSRVLELRHRVGPAELNNALIANIRVALLLAVLGFSTRCNQPLSTVFTNFSGH